MPDNLGYPDKPAGNEPAPPATQPANALRKRRSLDIDKEKVVSYVLTNLERDLWDRESWQRMRLDRYAKLRGWLPEKTDPIGNLSSNIWLPIMLAASLTLKATLENATKSIRPLMVSKARQRRNTTKQERVDKLIDFQLFGEADGERVLDDFISGFVDDGTAVTFQRWVRKEELIYDVKLLPPLQPDMDHQPQLFRALDLLFPSLILANPSNNGQTWKVTYGSPQGERSAIVDFYSREDNQIEAHVKTRTTTFDGPAVEVVDLEDIVVPIRSANLQPPGPDNPHGAPHVAHLCKARMDEIVRGYNDGTYDLLTEKDLEAIKASRSSLFYGSLQGSRYEELMKEEKDRHEGSIPTHHYDYDSKQIVRWFGRWDIDGDGEEEEVIFWIARDAKKLMRAKMLTEMYPGIPICRPFAEARLFSVPNRFYGVSLPELLESLQDSMKALMDQNIDWGTITNSPFGFYRASSGIEPEVLHMMPGELYPLNNPVEDVSFPSWNKDQSWAINTLTLLNQYVERLNMRSDFGYGRIPAGKASALRTTGTTMALMKQQDIRSEQILRRLLLGISQIYQLIHRLNRRYLPRQKEFRVLGVPEKGEDAYMKVSPEQIDIDADFEFKASLLNTNRQALSGSLAEVAAVNIGALPIQLGIVGAEEIYQLMRDMHKARDLDPDKYLKRPPNFGPRILAEEAISAIMAGEFPVGTPLESAAEHLAKVQAFQASDMLGLLDQAQLQKFQAYMGSLLRAVAEEQQKAALMAAAAQTQAAANGGGGGSNTSGVPDLSNTPVGKNELLDESLGARE